MNSKHAAASPLTSWGDEYKRYLSRGRAADRGNPWAPTRIPTAGVRLSKLAINYGLGLTIVALITLFYRFDLAVNTTTVGFTFLLAILSASSLWGLGVSSLMSVAAMLAFDYFFLPPIGSLDIADPQDWVALLSFLITAVLGSTLSARAHNRAEEANRRRHELERLYALSQRLVEQCRAVELCAAIPRHVLELFAADAAALFLAATQEVYRGGICVSELAESQLRLAAGAEEVRADATSGWWFTPLRLGAQVIGSLGISGPALSKETKDALGYLIAVSIERAGANERIAKIEAVREGEKFKSVMLDAITHDFRTPLTCIKSSVTALLSDLEFNREQTSELLAVVDEECDRIDQLLDHASELAQLESGMVKLDARPHSIGELLAAALVDCPGVSRARTIHCEAEHAELRVLADLRWTRSVLVHLIVNAHLYSSPGLPITIHSEQLDGFAQISVADQGPGIEEAEAGRIFEKFYRCENEKNRAHGTGMGLPIARAIVEAHGGAMRVSSRRGCGSTFTFTLPLDPRFAANLEVS